MALIMDSATPAIPAMEQKLKFVYLPENILQPLILFLHYTENKKETALCDLFFEYEYVYKVDGLNYLVTISTGILKIFATFKIVSICLPVAAAI